MGIEFSGMGVTLRNGVLFAVQRCFRSVCDHPFLVVFLCFVICLYRSFPSVFSFLVSASPVLVCTAVLLGTLLSFGQSNIPEIEREEKATHYQSVSLQTGSSGNVTVVEKKPSYNVGRYSEKERDEVAQLIEQPSLSASGGSLREDGFNNTVSLTEERSWDTRVEKGTVWETGIDVGVLASKPKTEWNEEILSDGEAKENMYAAIRKMDDDEHNESDDEKSDADSFDSERVNVDSLDSPPHSPWKRVDDMDEKREEEEEDDDDALESGSDGAESSSPDASMADIMPMLDELHPLLDEEAPLPVHMSNDDSDAVSELSPKSSISSHDEGSENNEELEAADEDNEDGENEENEQENKNELTNSAITWTEEDQKNLMDLGSSEIERNQRLENLILRRRSRKNMSMVNERNLIDIESFDTGFNLAPISTARQNPFDLPRDSYDNMGLPPIPGSAPSILLPRRNPFDIPYDSTEEKPDLMGDGFKEEFTTFQSREPFFRRHESFNVGPSIFASTRQEKQGFKMRPYFVPEHMASEQSSYSRFQRQSSELSDSKASSVPETESISSVEDLEGRMVPEDNNAEPDLEMNDAIEEGPSGNLELIMEREEIPGEYTPLESEMISDIDHVSENVGHGSQSSEEDGSIELGFNEKRDVEFEEIQFQMEGTKHHYEERSESEPLDTYLAGNHLNSEAIEQRHNNKGSSSTSLSEVSERMCNETDGEQMLILEGEVDDIVEEPGISSQTSVQSTDLTITFVGCNPPREPVYDSSPTAERNKLSSPPLSSDVHVESDLDLPIVLDKQTMTSAEKESVESSGENYDIPSSVETQIDSSNLYPVDGCESGHVAFVDKLEPDNINSTFSELDGNLGSSIEASLGQNILNHHIQSQDPSSSSEKYFNDMIKLREDQNLGQSDMQKHVLISVEECPAQVNEPSPEGELTTNPSTEKEKAVESPNSDNDIYHKACQKLISTPSAGMSVLHLHDKLDHRQIYEHPNEVQVPNTPVELFLERKTIDNLSSQDLQELHHHISQNGNSPSTSPDFNSVQSSDSVATSPHVDMHTIVEEDDEIEDIGEELLSELDSIGDFSVQQQGVTSNELEKQTDFVKEGIPSAQIAESNTASVVEKEDHILHSVGSVETQGTSLEYSELHVGDVPIPDRANKEDFAAENIPTVKDNETVDAKKQDDKVEEHKDLHSTKSGQGKHKASKSSNSSSGSSSSSDSSSSDSDKE